MSTRAHQFIFTPGVWLGEGNIRFSASPEDIKFYTRWESAESDGDELTSLQTVQMQGVDDKVLNRFRFHGMEDGMFKVERHNELVNTVLGTGIIDNDKIAWEFRGQDNFEGFEVYTREKDELYIMHAEFASSDQFRTIIDGKIWQKSD